MKQTRQQRQARPGRSDVPANPLPAPNIGEANIIEPTEQAEQATWQTYRSSTGHAEPPGHLDRRGVRKLDSTGRKRSRRFPSRSKRESTGKDE